MLFHRLFRPTGGGTGRSQSNVASQELASQELASQELASQEFASQGILSHMLKALIVDDNSTRLARIRRSIDQARLPIGAFFTSSLAEAESSWDEFRFDVAACLVERMDGPAARTLSLIESVKPEVARVLFTDNHRIRNWSSPHLVMSANPSVSDLNRGLHGAARWKERLEDVHLAEIVAGARKLPSLPDVYLRIQEEIHSSDPALNKIGHIIETDPALGLTVLRVVNSSLFGLKQEVGDIVQATALLGMRTISSLVLAASLYSSAALDKKLTTKMWNEALRVGSLAREIARAEGLGRALEEESQLAGLLHDVGDIVLLQHWPKKFVQVDLRNREEDERRLFGATHADIGAYLVAVWGLPSGVVDAVGFHHKPSDGANPRLLSATTAVHIARTLHDLGADVEPDAFDREHLQHVCDVGRVDAWRGLIAA